ncbi:hypothetical protein JK203_11300 [Gluconobacter cerinus]|uniref:hypothetical protein n=1 Tax=Gluconobacter cerinus TaxID=38307 RepID=UPI001B8B78AB|nr:hypothetical protein [Gluconobacter cerinus]MBS1041423.1 hypothetical protein [Gluconobacter cerinus]MBS1048011.1 hypothetical protein [Gluconobacter cerinus]
MTAIKVLLEHFNKPTGRLKTRLRDIADQILRLSPGHFITYREQPKDDSSLLLGMLEQIEDVVGWEAGVHNIVHYCTSLDPYLRRLVICKELIHILDPECYLTKTPTEVDELMSILAEPTPIKEGSPHGDHDHRTAVVLATGVLFPLARREELMAAYTAGTLSAQKITDHVKIPRAYVDVVMAASWPAKLEWAINKFETDVASIGLDEEAKAGITL